MENLIKHGPLTPAPVKDQPTPSNLESIMNKEKAEPISGHDVRLRTRMEDVKK